MLFLYKQSSNTLPLTDDCSMPDQLGFRGNSGESPLRLGSVWEQLHIHDYPLLAVLDTTEAPLTTPAQSTPGDGTQPYRGNTSVRDSSQDLHPLGHDGVVDQLERQGVLREQNLCQCVAMIPQINLS